MNEDSSSKRQEEIRKRAAYTAAKGSYMDSGKRVIDGAQPSSASNGADAHQVRPDKTPSETVAEAQAKAAAKQQQGKDTSAGSTPADV